MGGYDLRSENSRQIPQWDRSVLAEQGSGRGKCVDSKQRFVRRGQEAFVGINARRLTVDRAVPCSMFKNVPAQPHPFIASPAERPIHRRTLAYTSPRKSAHKKDVKRPARIK